MAIVNSGRSVRTTLPAKPSPDFPLTPHRSGKWCKKHKGRLYYFGRWDDPDEAKAEYEHCWPYIVSGKPIPPNLDRLTLEDFCNLFLEAKDANVESGELSARSFRDYRATCKRLVEYMGRKHVVADLKPADFQTLRTKLAKRFGPTTLGNEVNRVRIVFKWGFDQELLETPIRFGQGFARPSRKTIRKHRNERARTTQQTFSADDIQTLIDAADVQLRAMILLGINCGLGNADVGHLRFTHLDLDGGWIDYPRPKTELERHAKLWPETVAAIREWLKQRPKKDLSADVKDLVFITKFRKSWAKEGTTGNPVSAQFRKLLVATEVYREGLGFYALRHTFATIGRQVNDDAAIRVVLGHDDPSMLERHYTHEFPKERLEAVASHVRTWAIGLVQQ
ncbi:MAG: site-specific integrase [Pirellulaceae bacterium]